MLDTVDYVEARGKKPPALPFQTCALERERVVYQIGTGNAVHALKAAQVEGVLDGRGILTLTCFLFFFWR